jgi:Tol biopolymer transport system component/DNA-binding winged helix-turn-helix (wHTH) protein
VLHSRRELPVSSENPIHRIVRFGVFEVDLEQRELRRSGLRVKLQDQPFQVLAILLERPGEIVTREELRKKLWPADTFVDFDHGLNAAIRRLRDGLGDTAETPRFVETVARRGYRFVGAVESPERVAERARSLRGAPWRWIAGSLIAAVVACALYYARRSHTSIPRPNVIPAVTDAGQKYTPSLSPDGQHLAFAWNGGNGSQFSIYVKLVGTAETLRLTKEAAIDFDPVWSPDGRHIAFCRIQEGQTGVYIIPALGGTERKLRSTVWKEQTFDQVIWSASRLAWSTDGKSIAFSDSTAAGEPYSIFSISVDSQEVRRLTSASSSRWDANPAFSPDGKMLAFTRALQAFEAIYVVRVSGGQEQLLVSDKSNHWGLAWTADGKSIVFANASWPIWAGWLWKVSAHGGEPERMQFGEEGIQPSIRGNRLVYVRQTANLNIWRRKFDGLRAIGPAERLISSTRMESGPQLSRDGTRITFESTRSGAYEVWMCRSDGTGLVQLTQFNSSTGTPRWSPDGKQIAFDSRTTGNAEIYVIDVNGGAPRRVTSEKRNEVVPSFSGDGRSLYFASDRTGSWEVWKMPVSGGPAVQVTHHGGFAAFESPDGKFLYYAKGLTLPGIWRIPIGGGEETAVIDSLQAGYWGFWAVVNDGIYYLDSTTKAGVAFYDFNSRRITRLFDLEKPPAPQAPALAVSTDRKSMLYTQLDELSSDVILVENFR